MRPHQDRDLLPGIAQALGQGLDLGLADIETIREAAGMDQAWISRPGPAGSFCVPPWGVPSLCAGAASAAGLRIGLFVPYASFRLPALNRLSPLRCVVSSCVSVPKLFLLPDFQ